MLIRAWGSLRYRHLHTWMRTWLPKDLHGGLPGRSTLTATTPVLTAIAKAEVDGDPFIGVSLDYTACFDRIDVQLGVELLQRLGLPDGIAKPLLFMYANIHRTCRVGAANSDFFQAHTGIIQGCRHERPHVECHHVRMGVVDPRQTRVPLTSKSKSSA